MLYLILLCLFQIFLARQVSMNPIPGRFTIPLKRKTLSLDHKQSLISLLSSAHKEITNPNFLETKLYTGLNSQVKLKNFSNTQFVGSVGIGNPPQWLDVIFDTGSANFWVNSKMCYDISCLNHDAYDHELSQDYVQFGRSIEVQFGTGAIEGEINLDTVFIGGIVIPNQSFGEITEEKGDIFYEGNFAGILGLGFPSMSAYDQDPVFDNILELQLLDYNVFSFYYSLNPDETSEFCLGGIDDTKFKGNLIWTDVIKGMEYYWLINVDDIKLGNRSLGVCDGGCHAAVDTGTSLITAPSNQLERLLAHLDFECRDLDEMPDLVFVIEGKEMSIPARDYVMTVSYEGEDSPGTHSSSYDIYDCTLALMPLDVPPP